MQSAVPARVFRSIQAAPRWELGIDHTTAERRTNHCLAVRSALTLEVVVAVAHLLFPSWGSAIGSTWPMSMPPGYPSTHTIIALRSGQSHHSLPSVGMERSPSIIASDAL
jgi:hypothetical protein